MWQQHQETIAFIRDRIPDFDPEIAIVLGSGLGRFVDKIETTAVLPYAEIPHFKPTAVLGHAGNLVFGTLAGRRLVCQQGRYHYYEGHTIAEVVFPIRIMHGLGARTLLVSNASGGIDRDFRVGDIMVIRDHINFTGTNPLLGPNEPRFGPRFPDMTYAYHPDLRNAIHRIAGDLDIALREGVYIGVSGPTYETPAEIDAFRILGAHAVGMSTVPEVIAANHVGMKVLGLSCIANAAAASGADKLDHGDIEQVIGAMSDRFENLVAAWIAQC